MEYYQSKGYNCKIGDTIEIEAEDITEGSKMKIEYICDICGQSFTRSPSSNKRAKKEKLIDTCSNCSRQRAKMTCLERYGVDNAMKKEEFQRKCEESKQKANFESDKNYSSSGFEKGIPVSAGQYRITSFSPDFEVNYHLGKYYIDLFYNNIAIEYDGKGHDLQVRMGKISLEGFQKKEEQKTDFICQSNRLLRIKDPKDKVKKENFEIEKLEEDIKSFIKSDELYKKIEIK